MAHSKTYLWRTNNPNGRYKPMKQHVAHFRTRLKERFGIEITSSEYGRLVKRISSAKRLYSVNSGNILYSMDIEGKEVWVLYGSAQDRIQARLKTALIPYDGYIVPSNVANKYDHNQFTQRMNEVIVRIKELSKEIDLNNKKEFFCRGLNRTLSGGALKYLMTNDEHIAITCAYSFIMNSDSLIDVPSKEASLRDKKSPIQYIKEILKSWFGLKRKG